MGHIDFNHSAIAFLDSPALSTPPSSPLAHELQELWRSATPDSIGRDLVAARAKVEAAPVEVQEEVAELMMSLEQLERWLRDF